MSHPTKPTDVGTNRTGLAMSPFDGKDLVEAAEEHSREITPDGQVMSALRLAIAREARPVGTMPPPMTVKGAVKTVVAKLKGEQPTVFLDKLGERLAYERGGARLYEALMVKLEASDSHDPTLTRAALMKIHEDELTHAGIVAQAIESMGGDPTAVTPCADVISVATLGFIQVLTDPRTTLTQCLNAMLAIELADGASWEILISMAQELEQDALIERFREAELAELRHQEMVRSWLTVALLCQTDKKLDVGRPSPAS